MRIAIRYYSRGGHVKAMAEALARGAGVEAISIDEPGAEITRYVDLLFIGGALYKFGLDPKLKKYLEELPEGRIGEAICFGSSFLTRRPVYLIQEHLKKKGAKINKQAIYARNQPNDDLLGVLEYFAQNEVTRDRSLDGLPPYLVFKKSQELKAQREAQARDPEAAAEAERRRAAEAAQAAADQAERAAQEAQAAAEQAAREAAQAAEEARARAEEAAQAAALVEQGAAAPASERSEEEEA